MMGVRVEISHGGKSEGNRVFFRRALIWVLNIYPQPIIESSPKSWLPNVNFYNFYLYLI